MAIVGGGISGLAAAYRLSRSRPARDGQLEIHVYEAQNRFGGVIETEHRDGFLMEKGPESFITEKPWALDLCRELGLENELIGTTEKARQSFILFKGKLFPVPQGFYLMAPTRLTELVRTPLLSWRGKIRAACERFIPSRKEEGDESIGNFVRRRFGQEILDRLAQPLISGIYSADPEDLSLEATFPHFHKMEHDHGSISRALLRQRRAHVRMAGGARYSLFLTLQGGMGCLISRLIDRMPAVLFHHSAKILRLEKNDPWILHSQDGTTMDADAVCLALPTARACEILDSEAPAVCEALRGIPYSTVATVNCAFRRKDVTHALNSSGFVVAGSERRKMIGCTFASTKFEGRVRGAEVVLLRAFLGGKTSESLLNLDDEKLGQAVCRELSQELGINDGPLDVSVARWPESLPEYRVGHRERVRIIFDALKSFSGLHLTGNAYDGTGIPDCIHHAFQTAHQILSGLENSVKKLPVGSL